MWLFTIFISASLVHYGLAEKPSMRCRKNVNCTDITEEAILGTDYWFELNDDNTLEVSASDERVVLAFNRMETGLEDENVPHFENEVRTVLVDVQYAKIPKGSYKQALLLLNIVYFEKLSLFYAKINNETILHPNHFEGLANLNSLELQCDYYNLYTGLDLEFLRPLVNLKELKLRKMIVPPMPQFAKLNKLVIEKGSFSERSQPIGECDNLETLEISEADITYIPDAWLSQCTKLRALTIENIIKLQALPVRLLQGNRHLRFLSINNCQIEETPNDLLSYTPDLQRFEFYSNMVTSLPKGFFKNTPNIEDLIFGPSPVGIDAEDELNDLSNLKNLVLDSILKYGLCRNGDNVGPESYDNYYKTLPFSASMPKLEYLSLQNAAVKKICPEWNVLFPALKKLNLINHSITNLTFAEMQVIHTHGWEVDMTTTLFWDDNLKIVFTENDFNTINNSPMVATNAKIILNEERECDCNWYWFVRTLTAKPGYVSLPGAKCTWYDPPGSKNKMTALISETPESKLACQNH